MSEGCEMNLLSLLSGWQVKLLLVITLVIGAYTWHKVEVNKAVSQATAELELGYAREIFKIKDRANEETIALKGKITSITKEKNAKLKDADTKYDALLAWLSQQPRNPSSSNGVSNDAAYGESTERIAGTGLSERDAKSLAQYATDAEKLKEHLLACYKQHDEELKTQEEFKRKHTPKTD